jgi:hypothetical protein
MSNPFGEQDPGGGGRHPILSVLMAIVGFILLLPGLCSIIFMIFAASNPKQLFVSGALNFLVPLWIVSFAITAVGIFLLRAQDRLD